MVSMRMQGTVARPRSFAASTRQWPARMREPGFLSDVLQLSQSDPEAAPRLIGRLSELAGQAGRTGVGRRPGGAPAADRPGRVLPVRAARDGELRAAEGGGGRGGRRPCPLRLPAVPGGRAAAAAATRTGTAHRAPRCGRTGAEAGPAARAEADRGAHLVADYIDVDQGLSLSAIARRAGANVGDARARCSSRSWLPIWLRRSSTAPSRSLSPPSD